jgi:hypothetical protein
MEGQAEPPALDTRGRFIKSALDSFGMCERRRFAARQLKQAMFRALERGVSAYSNGHHVMPFWLECIALLAFWQRHRRST